MKQNRNPLLTVAQVRLLRQTPVKCSAVHGLFYRQIEIPLLGVFVFAKRGKPLLPTKEAKKD